MCAGRDEMYAMNQVVSIILLRLSVRPHGMSDAMSRLYNSARAGRWHYGSGADGTS